MKKTDKNSRLDRLDRIEKILNMTGEKIQQLQVAQEKLQAAQEKTDKEIDKTSKEIDKVGKEIDKVNKMVGKLTSGWGRFVEGVMEPSVLKWVVEDLKLNVERVMRNMALYKDNQVITEIDLLVEGTREDGGPLLVIVEAKSDFEASDMRKFKKIVANLFNYLPSYYKGIQLIVATAAMRFGDGVKIDALKSGFYVFEPEDTIMKLTKPNRPKIFSA